LKRVLLPTLGKPTIPMERPMRPAIYTKRLRGAQSIFARPLGTNWFGSRDSNPDSRLQRPLSYR
jgi:hypothetical protein